MFNSKLALIKEENIKHKAWLVAWLPMILLFVLMLITNFLPKEAFFGAIIIMFIPLLMIPFFYIQFSKKTAKILLITYYIIMYFGIIIIPVIFAFLT